MTRTALNISRAVRDSLDYANVSGTERMRFATHYSQVMYPTVAGNSYGAQEQARERIECYNLVRRNALGVEV